MDENPYRAPESQPEPMPLLGRWRRVVSTAAITLGVCGCPIFVLCLYQCYSVLGSDGYFPTATRLEFVTGISVYCGLGPGLVLLGLTIRKILRWRQFAIALICLAAAVAIYLVWWWHQLRVLPWPV